MAFRPLQATGLALPGADLDIVVLGNHSELQNPATGFSVEARRAIGSLLEVSQRRKSVSLISHQHAVTLILLS